MALPGAPLPPPPTVPLPLVPGPPMPGQGPKAGRRQPKDTGNKQKSSSNYGATTKTNKRAVH